MECRISEETIEAVSILAKLELTGEEKEQARHDMAEMLDYVDMLQEPDTEGAEPLYHIFPMANVFREDVVTNGDGRDAVLKNAPGVKDSMFRVPRTVE